MQPVGTVLVVLPAAVAVKVTLHAGIEVVVDVDVLVDVVLVDVVVEVVVDVDVLVDVMDVEVDVVEIDVKACENIAMTTVLEPRVSMVF